jgi:hypothetical protein
MNEVFNAFLAQTLNKPVEEVSELLYQSDDEGKVTLKENALDVLLNLDKSRISQIKGKSEEILNNGYKKAQAEILPRLEKEFREKTGYDSDKKGLELFLDYADSVKNQKVKLSDDEFKLDSRFLNAEKQWQSKINEEITKVKGEYEGKLTEYQSKEKQSKVFLAVDKVISGLNVKLPENQKAKENQKNAFLNSLLNDGYDYDFQEDGIIVKKGEARLEDEHGNLLKFDSFVKSKALDFFDTVEDDRDNNKNSPDNRKQQSNIEVPKDEKEYLAKLKECNGDKEKEIALYKLYNNK